ncbi:MAG: alcohol dehydrogenase catalytic domain-containing protein [Pirellulales bacterium]|nr:alcohol dehydrogenase catalytic domain-containing protein [Pirellulales bacterium]
MVLSRVASLDDESRPLTLEEVTNPVPKPGELLIRVTACGVCHTELDEIEGRTAPPQLPIVLGHEVVGRVEPSDVGTAPFEPGDRVGVGWIHSSSGEANENLSNSFCATGRDANGGYAEFMTVRAEYAYSIPEVFSDAEAAPLLCAGAIGYRALNLADIGDGARLGLMGFGGSAHLVLQMFRQQFPDGHVVVFARDQLSRDFAVELGADWAGDICEAPPEPLDAIIDTTPAWKPVVESMSKLRPGGRLVINAIRKEDADKAELMKLSYHDHLWMEREIKSVANITAEDIREFLPLAAMIPIRPEVTTYPLEEANTALLELKHNSVKGAKVLLI